MAAASLFSLAHLLFLFAVVTITQSVDLVYNGFNDTNLVTDGAATVISNGALRLTNKSNDVKGHAFHPDPLPFKTTSRNASSFSTYFVLAIVPSDVNRGGYGLAFTLSPLRQFPGAQGDHFLGILNSSNNGDPSNHIFAVEFDTVNGFNENSDADGNHVGININSLKSVKLEPASYFINGTKDEVNLESGERIQAWIDYDGLNKVVNVTISPLSTLKSDQPLISHRIDLSSVLRENMYIGFSAATGRKSSSHYILGWSFSLNGKAGELNLSRLPIPPSWEGKSAPYRPHIKALIAALSVLVFLLLVVLFSVVIYRRRMGFEKLEEWERDCPHRFGYKDLLAATKGFKDSELLGIGGFGSVYKGVLPSTGAEVAVKRISSNSLQGFREFAAEIESLGRLRHKNLVNLLGWCKMKNDLLLIYDYIPNGSLHSLLVNSDLYVLTWEQRFNIIKGIASGLLYLHEEWEKVVIHRDVKSSNVLIDADMNGRLGDFGLARLYEHGKNSHTTSVVGTIGYIAPELTRTGKASTRSDVYAYGVLLLEVASGKGPVLYDAVQGNSVILMDWVMECFQTGRILDAVDPRLNSNYVVEEMELVLGLGLLCSLPDPDCRPNMRQLTRFLYGDEPIRIFDKLCSLMASRQSDETASKSFFEEISTSTIMTSYGSSSIGAMSSSSVEGGR